MDLLCRYHLSLNGRRWGWRQGPKSGLGFPDELRKALGREGINFYFKYDNDNCQSLTSPSNLSVIILLGQTHVLDFAKA